MRLVGRTFSVAAEDVQSSLQTVGVGGQQPQQQPGQVPGFQLLSWLLVNQTSLPDMYHLLIGLMAGKTQPKTSSQVRNKEICSAGHFFLRSAFSLVAGH